MTSLTKHPVVLPPGTVAFDGGRWWRWNDRGLRELIIPRQHDRIMFAAREQVSDNPAVRRAAWEICAAAGCYVCRAMLIEIPA